NTNAQCNPTVSRLRLVSLILVINGQNCASDSSAEKKDEYAHRPSQPLPGLGRRCNRLRLDRSIQLRQSLWCEVAVTNLLSGCRHDLWQIVLLMSEHVIQLCVRLGRQLIPKVFW